MEFLFGLSIHGYKFLGIPWDIFLAILPCIVVYKMSQSIGKRKIALLKKPEIIAFVLIFLFWLFMVPNTAYFFMIPRHLVNYCDLWDKNRVCIDEGKTWLIIFFTTYTLIGPPTFYFAVSRMGKLIKSAISSLSAKIFMILIFPLISLGIMLGLLERFNSWDVLFKPLILLRTAYGYFTNTALFINFIALTICLYLIYYGFDYFILKILKK